MRRKKSPGRDYSAPNRKRYGSNPVYADPDKRFKIRWRKDSEFLQLSFSLGKVQYRNSLNTMNVKNAITLAESIYKESWEYLFGDNAGKKSIWLSEAIQSYLEHSAFKNKSHQWNIKKAQIIKEYFRDCDITSIGIAEVEAFQRHLVVKERLKESTANRYVAVLSGIFKQAKKIGSKYKIQIENPCSEVPRLAENKREMFFTQSQMEQILDYASLISEDADPRINKEKNRYYFYPYIVLMADLGARPSEIMNLTWSDVLEGCLVFKNTKNKRKNRRVYISDALYRFIYSLPRDQMYIIGTNTRTANTFRVYWEKVRDKFKLSKEFVIYTIRHTFVTHQVTDRGMDIAHVGKAVGHSSAGTTLGVYTHANIPEVGTDAVESHLRKKSHVSTHLKEAN